MWRHTHHKPQAAFPQHLNFQELLQLAQQQPPAPSMQPMVGQLASRDMLSQHATAQSLGLTMSMPSGLHAPTSRIGMLLTTHETCMQLPWYALDLHHHHPQIPGLVRIPPWAW